MCGIAGYVGFAPPDRRRIDATLRALQHRGPDGSGVKDFRAPSGRSAILIHTRLSIIDLDERASQPFQQGTRWWSYNGELYNYRELSAAFDDLRTSSDTEVLARVVQDGGWEALDACEGMWAFATYDESAHEFVLCRDRFGEKPLLVHRDTAGGLWFASETNALESLVGERFSVDDNALRSFIGFGYRGIHHGNPTFLQGVGALRPGEILRVDAENRETRRDYWRLSLEPETKIATFEAATAAVRDRLLSAMEIRLRADVPLAFCMSGGVDSMTLISIAKRVFDYDVHGFTIAQADERYDERDIIDVAAAELGLRHTYVDAGHADFLDELSLLVRDHGRPVATISYYVHAKLMQAIADHGYRVSVSGTAADELFTGYLEHFLLHIQVTGDADAEAHWREHVLPGTRNPALRDLDAFARDRRSRSRHSHVDDPAWVSFEMGEPPGASSAEAIGDALRASMSTELFTEVVPVILDEDDLNAMRYSIENRSPYLDRALYEVAQSIPSSMLIRNGYAKAVLREAARGIVPDVVVNARRKVGFNAAIEKIVDFSDTGVRRRVLADSAVWDYANRDAFAGIIAKPSLSNNEGKFAFCVLSAAAFLDGRAA